jgi:tetratricopeptide (TPR) repeat protein
MSLRYIIIVIGLALTGVLAVSSIKVVDTDEIALVGAGETVRELGPGINFTRPFAGIRRYELSQTHTLSGKDALVVRCGTRKKVRIECTLEIELDSASIRTLDLSFGGKGVDEILRPLLAGELSALCAGEHEPRSEFLSDQSDSVVSRINTKTGSLGIKMVSVSFGDVESTIGVVHDLQRSDGVKVFILGLDGYDWLVMEKVAETRDLANIDRIRSGGAWGNLLSMEPLVSPLIWTTMVTGVTPDVHGVTDFLAIDELTGEEIPVTSSMRRVPALWNITSLFDMDCGFIGWFASYPAEDVEGFVVTDRVAYHMFEVGREEAREKRSVRGLTYPPDLYQRIEPLVLEPEDVQDDVSLYIKGPIGKLQEAFDPDDPVSNLRLVISAYRTYEGIMRDLYAAYGPELFGIYFEFTDSIGHLFMKHMKPAMDGVSPEEAANYGQAMEVTYAEADRIIGEILDMLDDSAVLLIVSDHGFKSGSMRPYTDSRIGHGQAIEWHRMNGAIALYGGIVREGYEIADASVMDIAPTVLYLLGLPVDRKMGGRVLVDAFEESWVRSHAVTYTSAYDSLIERAEPAAQVSAADKALKDKLVSLGYVAGGDRALANLASYYHKNGRYAKALDIYREMLEEDPANLDVRIAMSEVYLKMGEYQRALGSLNEVLEKEPVNLKALNTLATVYIQSGNAGKALEISDRALGVDPGSGESLFLRGLSLQRLGRYAEAASAYHRALKLIPDRAEVYANLAEIYVSDRRQEQALDLASKAVELAPNRADMLYVLALALELSDRKQEALKQSLAAIRTDSTFVKGYLSAGRILLASGRSDSVILICDKALKVESPYQGYIHDMKGVAYMNLADLESAIREFKMALEADETLTASRMSLAVVYVNKGDKKSAEAELRKILSRYPDHAGARNLLETLQP